MQNIKNKNIIYAVAGLAVGIVVTALICCGSRGKNVATPGGMAHQMPDGSMMMGNGENMDMDDMMHGMMAGLEGKTGDAFDKEFLSEMIIHHQGAVEMAQAALKNAKHQEIKDLANDIITAQNKEIGMMEQWQAAWYK